MEKPSKFDKFVQLWNDNDEDVKEILASALYLLGRPYDKVTASHSVARQYLSGERLDLFRQMLKFTEEN